MMRIDMSLTLISFRPTGQGSEGTSSSPRPTTIPEGRRYPGGWIQCHVTLQVQQSIEGVDTV